MEKDPKIFIAHILASIENIESYTRGMDKESFLINRLVQDAVIRNIEVIGEATKSIPPQFRQTNSNVPWKQMAGMRDRLIHEYMSVDIEAVWNTVKKDLSALKINLHVLLEFLRAKG